MGSENIINKTLPTADIMTYSDIIAAADAPTTGFALGYLVDSATAPADSTYTDGYQITLKWTWSKTGGAAHADTQLTNVCVQYLGSDDLPLAVTDTVEGLPWVCLTADATGTSGNAGDLNTAIAVKTQTHAAYACYDQTTACTATLGTGQALPAGTAETAGTSATSAVLATAGSSSSTMKWFQPSYSSGDKVRGWNVIGGAGKASSDTILKTMMTKDTNVRTLVGASALATGVALGAAALAF